jgi:hypothetical protein
MTGIQVVSNDRFFGIKDHGKPREPLARRKQGEARLTSRGFGKVSFLVKNTILAPFLGIDRGIKILSQKIGIKPKKTPKKAVPAASPNRPTKLRHKKF